MKIQPSDKSDINIVLLESVHSNALECLQQQGFHNVTVINRALQDQELISAIENCHVLGLRSRTNIDKEVLKKAQNLMVIGSFCIGTNQIDLKECILKGIPVFNAPHSNTRSVAELVLGLTIMLFRDIFPKCFAAHRGVWCKTSAGSYEVRGKNIGIIGYGHIGSQVSILAESMGMHVYYYDIERRLPLGNAQQVKSLDDLLAISDVITLHVPETPITQNLFDDELFEKVKTGVCFINASRGSVVNIDALKRALQSKKIKGAAIDVFPCEPDARTTKFESPLTGMDNVILSPHIGGATEEAQLNIGLEVTQKLINFIDIGSTVGSVNFPSLSLTPHLGTHRIIHTHHNKPGMLKQINQAVADEDINVTSQYLLTTDDIGYVVLDIENGIHSTLISTLKNIDGTICIRTLY
jgi:D-3-phosphoglycerate dehydrogenase / 2-oxoglutarate reductase